MTTLAKLVIVDWNDLTNESPIHGQIEEAYGPNGLGILGIRNVPNFAIAKDRVLRFAPTLASLPNEYLENELTDPKTLYNAGWSHGKERMGNMPDTAKASFYYNPITDEPGTEQDRQDYPLSYPCNLWPDEALLPGFRDSCRPLGENIDRGLYLIVQALGFLRGGQDTKSLYQDRSITICALRHRKGQGTVALLLSTDQKVKLGRLVGEWQLDTACSNLLTWKMYYYDRLAGTMIVVS